MASAIHQLIAQQSGPDIVGSIGRGVQAAGAMQQVKMMPAQMRLAQLQGEQSQQKLDIGAKQLAMLEQQAAAQQKQQGVKFAADMGMTLSKVPPEQRAQVYAQLKQEYEQSNPMSRPLPEQYDPRVQQVLDFAVTQIYGDKMMDQEGKLALEQVKQEGKREMTPYQMEQLELQRGQNNRLAENAEATRSLAQQNTEIKRGELELKQGKPEREQAKVAQERQATFNLYQTAMDGVKTGLSQARVGPLAGRVPAFTTEDQVAEGAVSAMAPVLKQMFRGAGEGTFTDKDQELLLKMIPTRTDTPEAAAAKIENIDRIVRAKLSIGTQQQAPAPMAEAPSPAQQPQGIKFLGFE